MNSTKPQSRFLPGPTDRGPLISVTVAGREIEARHRRSARAKRIRIKVGGPQQPPVEVVTPKRTSVRHAVRALEEQAGWVAGRLLEMERRRLAVPALGMDGAGMVWLHGEALPAVASGVARGIRVANGRVEIPSRLSPGEARLALDRWYRRYAREWLGAELAREGERLGLHAARLSIRDQKTRWGSCSTNGSVSLNWRLVLMPEAIARYVVIHELVHLEIPNHSRQFWAAVEAASPGHRAAAAWLRDHGAEIQGYRPVAGG